MDLVGACRAFVSVSEYGGFTDGAAAAGMSQSVASRRIAALEERFGAQLFERTSRRPALTPFGRDMLASAVQLVHAADVLLAEAEAVKHQPWRLAVPATCSAAALARLVAEARGHGVRLDLRPAGPSRRKELLHAHQVRAALLAVPAQEASWAVPLGLAGARDGGARRIHVETLRLGRASKGLARRIWIQPEDDVPHIRDPLTRLRDAAGLRPGQVLAAPDLTGAAAEVLCSDDLLLCSRAQADELALVWLPIGELTPRRGYALTVAADGDPLPMADRLGEAIARCLSAEDPGRDEEREET
ncbi:LysR family transcriptional regulator [Streptomyces californicus]|uniref:LysR family transcriptional regulator n=1 Tax=Streptomyces californicus TaxID=67351 RepID=UPI001E3851BA|nr:LysR family transcriptional regulator [Streptomyces californicus]MCC0574390.1 LysR family transcriptional regulator [Streptomyces californicus]